MNVLDLRQNNEPTPPIEEPTEIPDSNEPSKFRRAVDYIFEIVKIVVISLIIIIPIRMYVVQPFIVDGDSMLPNFHHGEYLIVDEISYRFKEPQRGDVVIFHPPDDPKSYYIKRVIGLPGETVELREGKIFIHNEEITEGKKLIENSYLIKSRINEVGKTELKENQYYVVGDNRNNSLDSRKFGPISNSNIKGKAMLRAFPFNNMTIFKSPIYNYSVN